MGTGFHFEEGMPLFTLEGQDIPVILALVLAVIAVEVFLALKKDGRLGLVLPGLWLLYMLVRLVVRIIQVTQTDGSWLANPWQALAVAFVVENIPTLLLLVVCGLCQLGKGWRTRQQLNKTRIDDL